MTLDRINKAKALAEAHGGKSGKIIIELCNEIERLRRLTLRTGKHPVSVTDPWPYNPHLGTQICDLDDEFLAAWVKERSKEVMLHDWGLGVIARRDLALYELIAKHLKQNEQPDIKTETDSEALPQTT